MRLFGFKIVLKTNIFTLVCRINDYQVQKIPEKVVLTYFLTYALIRLIMCVLSNVIKMLTNFACALKEPD